MITEKQAKNRLPASMAGRVVPGETVSDWALIAGFSPAPVAVVELVKVIQRR